LSLTRRLVLALSPLAGGTAMACDLPLDLPSWDTRWTLVAAADTVDVDGLLPEGVRFGPEGFTVDSLLSVNDVLLDEVCEFCTCFEGPIPALEITPFDWAVPLPPGIATATLRSGIARIALVNGIGFDLLDSGEGEVGHLEVLLLDRRTGVALDSLRISQPFPPGDTLRASFPLAGLELHRDVVARVRGRIPGSGCDTIPLTPDMGIRTEVVLRDLVAGRVEVDLRDSDLNLPVRRVELPGPVSERLRPGEARVQLEVRLESTVPVGVEGMLSVAGSPADLYTERAALYTPLPIPAASPGEVVRMDRTYLLDLAGLEGARSLHLATANRVTGNRRIVVSGTERVAWTVTLHAEIPIR
jgi:hypothetical protein